MVEGASLPVLDLEEEDLLRTVAVEVHIVVADSVPILTIASEDVVAYPLCLVKPSFESTPIGSPLRVSVLVGLLMGSEV